MERYEIVLRRSVLKDLNGIPKKDTRRIMRTIGSLAVNPRPAGCAKLSGQEKYRIRQGMYRILYSIEDDRLIVYVVKVGHRRDVYR
ncbi:MAG: type II toxin-antitoxin system RelE/ParE family toxin [Candidatus Aureabacteria bacterium]|nr:type II toxin-antitoxin system RelE/ParE family toxin [Candidatus Auribacterota bacterium]